MAKRTSLVVQGASVRRRCNAHGWESDRVPLGWGAAERTRVARDAGPGGALVTILRHIMGKSIAEQLLNKGVVKPEDAPAARRAREVAARPPEPEKELPPPFEAPARGVIVDPKKRKA